MTTRAPDAADGEAGQRIYTPLVLRAYDLVVLGFSNRFAWHCPSERMLGRYDPTRPAPPRSRGRDRLVPRPLHVARRAAGDHTARPKRELAVGRGPASRAVRAAAVRANALDPLPLGDVRFESAAANYLLHCLPGPIEAKAAALAANVRPYLEPGGVLFGSTHPWPRRATH